MKTLNPLNICQNYRRPLTNYSDVNYPTPGRSQAPSGVDPGCPLCGVALDRGSNDPCLAQTGDPGCRSNRVRSEENRTRQSGTWEVAVTAGFDPNLKFISLTWRPINR